MDFETWIAEVDIELNSRIGLSTADLPDDYWGMWIYNLTPAECADEVIEKLGTEIISCQPAPKNNP